MLVNTEGTQVIFRNNSFKFIDWNFQGESCKKKKKKETKKEVLTIFNIQLILISNELL